jgi:pimeloyl-ACP methyl ester carboxylesterase
VSDLPASVRAWEARGAYIELAGVEVFAIDTGFAPASAGAKKTATVVIHGFPTSSHDFHRVLPLLGERRVIFLDLPGYGLSDKPAEYSYSLFEQADLVEMLLRERGVKRAHVIAHDMGTSIACELVARRARGLLSFEMRSLLLMNGSVYIEMAHLTPSQHILLGPLGRAFARIGSRRVFDLQMGRIVGKPLSDEDLESMWALVNHKNGKARLPDTIGYVEERRRFHQRWTGALRSLGDVPTKVLWGPRDTVAVFEIAERLARDIPGASLERLDGLGHYPQLEDPEQTGAALRTWLDSGAVAG